MGANTAYIACPSCTAQNTPSREVCFKCREPLHVLNGTSPPLPSVFNLSDSTPSWSARIWRQVSEAGEILDRNNRPLLEIVVREIGTDSLVFDSNNSFQPSEGVILEFTLEGRRIHLEGSVRRTARTLGMDMGFATTVDLNEPDEVYLETVSRLNPEEEMAWRD